MKVFVKKISPKNQINKSEVAQHMEDFQGTHQNKIDRLKNELAIARKYLRNESVRKI